jgi:hypothetical protein
MTAIVANTAGGRRRSYQGGTVLLHNHHWEGARILKTCSSNTRNNTTTRHRPANMQNRRPPYRRNQGQARCEPHVQRRGILLRRLAIQQRQHEPEWRAPSVIYGISITPSQPFPLPLRN